jgi:hypothetical protein
MKRIAVLLALFCAGLLLASFALADNGGGNGNGKGKNKQTSSTGTTTNGKGKGKDAKKCRNISLKGTAGATTFTVTVTKANKAGRDLKTATVTFSGQVNINGTMCSEDTTGATATTGMLKLRNLHVGKATTTTTG